MLNFIADSLVNFVSVIMYIWALTLLNRMFKSDVRSSEFSLNELILNVQIVVIADLEVVSDIYWLVEPIVGYRGMLINDTPS